MPEAETPSDALIRRWVNMQTACMFASGLAKKGTGAILYRTVPSRVDAQTASLLNASLDDASDVPSGVVFTFPFLRTAADVALLVRALSEDQRWRFSEASTVIASGLTTIQVTWRTKFDQLSRVMGLAPLGSMPVTRRAPYVALFVWPGKHANPHRPEPQPKPSVSVVDMPPGVQPADYHDVFKKSQDSTKALLDQTMDGPLGTKMTFRLESSVRGLLFDD
jgi:hypothetical protein